jgi:hypothetical protein
MPLTSTANQVEAPKSDFKPVPEDVYQVVIKDVDEKILPVFQAKSEDDVQVNYHFKFVILDGETADSKEQMVSAFCTNKWFGGNKRMQASKLVSLVKAVYAFYYPKLKVEDLTADEMTPAVINDLIGKQLRVSVKFNAEKTGNKVTEFMAIKKEIELPETVKLAEVAKKMLAKPTDEAKQKPAEEETGDSNDPPF